MKKGNSVKLRRKQAVKPNLKKDRRAESSDHKRSQQSASSPSTFQHSEIAARKHHYSTFIPLSPSTRVQFPDISGSHSNQTRFIISRFWKFAILGIFTSFSLWITHHYYAFNFFSSSYPGGIWTKSNHKDNAVEHSYQQVKETTTIFSSDHVVKPQKFNQSGNVSYETYQNESKDQIKDIYNEG